MRIGFDFGDLEAFLVLYETGSFVAAARHLGQSQSALTRRVRKLEEELGTRLFDRTTRSVRPTLAAKRLRGRAQAMMDDARETLRELQDDTARYGFQTRAIVTLASVPSAIPRLVIPALGLYGAGSGASRVRLLDLLANEVVEAVQGGEADFGITSLATEEPGLRFETLYDDRIVLAVPADHPMAGEGPVKWADLEGQRLILPAQGGGNRALIDRALAGRDLRLFWTYEVPRTATALELVRAELGVAALPLAAVPLRDGEGLILRPLVEPVVSRRFGLVTRAGTALPEGAKALCDVIRAEAARRGPRD
ncbi:LysR family transcriptional regulator [Maritimibacter alkaliphilus]|uniref:LysR family transcriptional regulator n=1 Tax=Maritimibacter alkaliphilus TaxID=404236 RepID=UPI001C93DA40|nr:LysR family transcriptional regulator [Maritimibacter alkaliphilus]MBY6092321.1 LysR family transcriptional regulator [Maritimibacter alkaliphilus]